ncbi:hypothetical protein LJR039_007424 [Pseudorhodoferax sp. LjRoot39]|uniref:hypothetical protein n=1 Tax=Pseudorhodoferax sp. LjRoot39 TaxID=3342328 RepID=UPI003ECDDBA0
MQASKLSGQDVIGVRVGKIINRFKLVKHFDLQITQSAVPWARTADSITSEAALDGLYIIRTSVPAAQMVRRSACAATSPGQRGAGLSLDEDHRI